MDGMLWRGGRGGLGAVRLFSFLFSSSFWWSRQTHLCALRERQRENENRKLASKPNLDRHTLKRTRTQSNSSFFFILNYTKYFCCFSFDFLSNTIVCEFTRHSSTGVRWGKENHGKSFEVKNHHLLFREFWNTHDRETDRPMREMFFFFFTAHSRLLTKQLSHLNDAHAIPFREGDAK